MLRVLNNGASRAKFLAEYHGRGNMRKLAISLMILVCVAMAHGAAQLTVAQLDRYLSQSESRPDAALADELARMELTERADARQISRWSVQVRGPKSRLALIALTDAAAFLPPPTAAVPDSSTPEIAMQRRIWSAAVDYVTRMVPTLPNFFADRVTWRFDNSPLPDKSKAEPFHPLRYVGGSTVTVLYRDRREVVAPGGASTRQENDPSFSTNGEFGASLDMIFGDVSSELPSWSGWEHGSNGNYSVFRYVVGRGASHYAVYSRRTGMFASAATAKEMPGYHGEIVVDPANGAVMRLTVIPDINPMSSISRADILIEYGPVEIGGRTYICPISSVAIAQVRTDGMPAGLAPWGDNAAHSITRINHVDFQRYHLFRAESRIVTGDTVETKKP